MAGRRPDIRAPLAIGTLVVALALLGLAFGGPLGSTAGRRSDTAPALAVIASDGSNPTVHRRQPRPRCDRVEAPSTVPTSTASGPEVIAAPDVSTPEPAGGHADLDADRRANAASSAHA